MKSLRDELKLTQRELAQLVGVSRGVVAMYEKGKRNLPAKAILKLGELHLCIQQPGMRKMQLAPQHSYKIEAQKLKIEKQLNADARRASAQAVRLSMVLSDMQQRYASQLQKLFIINEMMLAATPATKQMSMLENMQLDVLEAMEKCNTAKQVQKSYQLAILKAKQQAALTMVGLLKQKFPNVNGC